MEQIDQNQLRKQFYRGLYQELDPVTQEILTAALRSFTLDGGLAKIPEAEDNDNYAERLEALNAAFGTGTGYNKG